MDRRARKMGDFASNDFDQDQMRASALAASI